MRLDLTRQVARAKIRRRQLGATMAGPDRRAVLGALACVAAPAVGRADNHWPDYPGPSAPALAGGDGDVVLQVYPMTDPAEVATYFGASTTDLGIAPIWLSVANRTLAQTFLLDAEKINVAREDEGLTVAERSRATVSSAPATGVEAAGQVAQVGLDAAVLSGAIPFAAPVALPLLIVGNGVMVHQGAIRRNLIAKQLYSHTLGPGQSAAGFIYVRVKKGFTGFASYRLKAPLTPVPSPPGAAGKIYVVALNAA